MSDSSATGDGELRGGGVLRGGGDCAAGIAASGEGGGVLRGGGECRGGGGIICAGACHEEEAQASGPDACSEPVRWQIG